MEFFVLFLVVLCLILGIESFVRKWRAAGKLHDECVALRQRVAELEAAAAEGSQNA